MEQHSLLLRNEGALPLSDFYDLADIPPEVEWFANLDNANTKKAYDARCHRVYGLCHGLDSQPTPAGHAAPM